MKPAIDLGTAKVFHGNSLDVLPTLPDNSIDAIVTDPPYELGFMGKSWDSSGIAYSVELWRECLRVLKPGGHILAFGGSRTWHRLAVAIEDSGFQLRDSIAWLYGSGFPKSMNIAKAIDKAADFQGEVLGTETVDVGIQGGSLHAGRQSKLVDREIRSLSPDAQNWQGWGTALKPAFEPVVVGRKPLIGTVAENVLAWGVGGLNIDASRIRRADGDVSVGGFGNGKIGIGSTGSSQGEGKNADWVTSNEGRWPANIILDEFTASLLPESGPTGSGKVSGFRKGGGDGNSVGLAGTKNAADGFSDSGSVSRFFYVAKASKRDRNEGLDGLPEQASSNFGSIQERSSNPAKQNFHPTVKPTELMRYLIKLVTPPGGVVLDPFTGSGSTGKAALLDGFEFVGIELTDEYLPIIEGRLRFAISSTLDKTTLF